MDSEISSIKDANPEDKIYISRRSEKTIVLIELN